MGKGAQTRTNSIRSLAIATAVALTVAACGGGGDASRDDGEVTLEFAQWWEPELPDGALRSLMDQFEEENPGITVELISGPFSSTRDQITAGAASGTMADVVGLDGGWVHDFVDQGAIADLSELMSEAGYDDSELAAQIQVEGSTYMIPVVNFAYMLFANEELLAQAGVEAPTNRSEFLEAAQAVADLDGNTSGWALPLSLESPAGAQNDVMSWVWASGGHMLADGQPDATNEDMVSAVEFIMELSEAGVLSPGTATLQEQDKVEEFTNGRVGMMISSLAHINLIRENNPELDFSLHPVPPQDGYTGEQGVTYASWGIGVSANSEHPEEAWKLVEFLLSEGPNTELSTAANAFPGNTESVPEFVAGDDIYEAAFTVWSEGYPENEFTGLPVADQLKRELAEELQRSLQEGRPAEETLQAVQERWEAQF